MNDASGLLRRWHALPRADRKAILTRLDDDQRRGLMAMIETDNRAARVNRHTAAAGWAIFSPPMAQMLQAIEAAPDASPADLRVTPAAAGLLLATARDLRDSGEKAESWLDKAGLRWRQWLKDMDL